MIQKYLKQVIGYNNFSTIKDYYHKKCVFVYYSPFLNHRSYFLRLKFFFLLNIFFLFLHTFSKLHIHTNQRVFYGQGSYAYAGCCNNQEAFLIP